MVTGVAIGLLHVTVPVVSQGRVSEVEDLRRVEHKTEVGR